MSGQQLTVSLLNNTIRVGWVEARNPTWFKDKNTMGFLFIDVGFYGRLSTQPVVLI